MNIAFVITRADAIGGATVHVRDLSRALSADGHRTTVLLSGNGPVSRELKALGIPVVSLRYLRRDVSPLQDVLAIGELRRAIDRIQPDVVSAHTAKAGCIARLACARTSVPVLYTPHGWTIGGRVSRAQGFVYRQVERRLAPLSAAIINVCYHERRLAMSHEVGEPNQHWVVYNGMPDIAPRLRAEPSLQPCRIIMVARFEEPKDHATLLQALGGLRTLPWDLELVGDGPNQAAARRMATALGLADRVRFRGALSSAAAALAEAQIFVLSSRSEGFPRSILEAMRAGLPVVASDVGGVAEAVRDGSSGFVVPPRSAVPLRSALESLIREPFLRSAFGSTGRRLYEQRFTFQRMLDETVSIYREVIGDAAGVREGRGEWQALLR